MNFGNKDSKINTRNNQYTLLIVDDNEVNRHLMAFYFKRYGYQVELAENGYKALEMIKTLTFDLMLLDIMMPGINGLEVLEQVRKQHTLISLPIIMVTADDQEESVTTALQIGANDYLIKPFNLPVALARINTQLKLKELAKLQDEFVKFASHDLKKPLLVMMDIIAEIKKTCMVGEIIGEDTPELIDLVESTGDNMQKVIAGFLDTKPSHSTSLGPKYETIRLNEIIDKSIKANEHYARKKGGCKTNCVTARSKYEELSVPHSRL